MITLCFHEVSVNQDISVLSSRAAHAALKTQDLIEQKQPSRSLQSLFLLCHVLPFQSCMSTSATQCIQARFCCTIWILRCHVSEAS